MYIKQIISVHPRSSCTIFCAKCGTALLKIRPFEGFAPQLYPENPKMRYSSTQAPTSPSALASRISLHPLSRISLLPGFRGFSLRHSTYGSLRRCTEPAIARKRRGTGGETAVKRRKNGGTSGKTENRRRTGGEPAGKRRGKGGEPAKNGETSGRTEKRKRTENRRGREEREEKRRNRRRTEKRRGNGGTGGKTENRRRREEREEKRRGREEVINRRGCANCIEFQRFLRKLLINKK